MSLDTVVEDIRDEARARAAEIKAEGDARAEEIVADAEADAQELLEAREEAVDRRIEQEREQSLSSAKLEAKQARLATRRDLLEEVRETVETELRTLDRTKREALTRELLESAATEFEGADEVAVYGRAADETLLTEILEDYDGYSFAGSRDCLGGVILESESSRVRVNNTFDSVLDDVWDENLKDLSAQLFDQ
ncbi:V-type ATP synthase subunit E [Haloferacaceae archaeon DSL9]